jgi:hypothetical protein
MTESLKFSQTYPTNEEGDNHPALTANTQYVMEFYTSCSGRLEEINGSLLPLPLNNQFKLRYFAGPTSTTCTDTYIEYENPTGNCQFNTGRFTSGVNCSPNLEHNYGNSQEVWEHVSMTFTAADAGE